MREQVLLALRRRWPWIGLSYALCRIVPELWGQLYKPGPAPPVGDVDALVDELETDAPPIVCIVLINPTRQLTATTADIFAPVSEAYIRRVSLLWAQLGREACYQLIDALGAQQESEQ